MIPGRKRVLANDPYWIETNWKFALPVGINYLVGSPGQSNFLELGLQGTLVPKETMVDSWSSLKIERERIINRFMLSGFLGYRFSPVKKGVVFRAGYNPMILDGELVGWVGASIGWKFMKKR